MKVVYSRCCGLDVHKDSLTACFATASGNLDAAPAIRARAASLDRSKGRRTLAESVLWTECI